MTVKQPYARQACLALTGVSSAQLGVSVLLPCHVIVSSASCIAQCSGMPELTSKEHLIVSFDMPQLSKAEATEQSRPAFKCQKVAREKSCFILNQCSWPCAGRSVSCIRNQSGLIRKTLRERKGLSLTLLLKLSLCWHPARCTETEVAHSWACSL